MISQKVKSWLGASLDTESEEDGVGGLKLTTGFYLEMTEWT